MKKIFLFLAAVVLLTGCNSSAGKKGSSDAKIELSVLSTYQTGIFDESAAEINAYDPESKRLFFVNAHKSSIEILDLADPANPVKIKDITFGEGSCNSVSVFNGLIAAAVEAKVKQDNGMVYFLNIDGDILKSISVGALPDMVTFTPDGKYVLVANEGEPNSDYSVDPVGSVTIFTMNEDVKNLSNLEVRTVGFTEGSLQGDVRITGPEGTTVSQDVEPEYIAVSDDSAYAYVCLQENNSIAKIDIAAGKLLFVQSLGLKDHSRAGAGLDGINDGQINIKEYPLFGMYMPDAIASYTVNGNQYIVTANEGDGREYGDEDNPSYADETKLKKVTLDPAAFPDAEALVEELGDLKISSQDGDSDDDGDFDKLYTFGARSFTIWNDKAELVWDSGDQFEQIVARTYPDYFNSSNDEDAIDGRSKSKGPEPEGVCIGKIAGSFYAFVLLERVGGVMVYDITKPTQPQFVQYINNRTFGALDEGNTEKAGDLGPEGVTFITAEKSPNGEPLLVVTNEVSGTVTIYSISVL